MKYILPVFSIVLLTVLSVSAQRGDTLHVKGTDLNIKGLQTGDYSYLIIQQKAVDSPASSITIAKMNVTRETYHNKQAIVVRQQWDHDSMVHKSYAVFDARDFSTLLHDTWWLGSGFGLVFDFETRKVELKPDHAIPDSMQPRYERARIRFTKELDTSFEAYNLNWHDDLVIYSMLPYKENRTFMINFYDPGYGIPKEVPYTVTGSGQLTDRDGAVIDCWMLQHGDDKFTEKFWISKKTREVLKEEDYGKDYGYRFKYKLGVGLAGVPALPATSAVAQRGDTVRVKGSDLDIKGLQTGDYSYLIVRQKALDSPAMSMAIAKMNVARENYHDKPAIVVRQQWDRDSMVHKAYSVFDANDFSTLLHDTYWRVLGYALVFDFEKRKFDSRPVLSTIPDSVRTGSQQEMDSSFGAYNLNWHDDLVIYSMLPYKENRTFIINYYDPGFGKPAEVPFTCTGSGKLTDRDGASIDCWILEHDDAGATEKYWISKKTREVLKEEDHIIRTGGYRFKYKLGVGVTG
jgi:hypothetical protein